MNWLRLAFRFLGLGNAASFSARSRSADAAPGAADRLTTDRASEIQAEGQFCEDSPIGRWETVAVVCIFVTSFLVQGNALLHHGYMGQDYGRHSNNLRLAMQMSHWWLYAGTNPPLLYWLGSFIHHITLSDSYEAILSLIVVLLNLIALHAWFKLSQSMIQSPLLRIGALVTLTFLPFRLIHTEVLAADGLTVLPFSLVILLFVRILRSRNPRRQLALVALLAATMVFGVSTKFTMVSAVPVALLILVYFRRNFTNRVIWAVALVLIVAIPAMFARTEYKHYQEIPDTDLWKPTWRREMYWRNLLFVKAADLHILRAPKYDETIQVNGQPAYNLLINNKYSYPALLHLSMYTDVLNIFQYDPTDSYIGTRSEDNQRRMALSVKSAVLLSALTVVAVVAYLLRILYCLWRDRDRLAHRRVREQAVVLGFSLAFYVAIAGCLPYIENVYYFGYWLSRLVTPALLGFIFIGFVFLDEYVKSRPARVMVFIYAVVQSALHLSFLWPRGP